MKSSRKQYILLTGPPGIGKTTLIKKVCDISKEKNYELNGFFTEEVRENRERIGFDVVLLDGRRAPLARVHSSATGPRVGKYTVDVNSFERLCLSQLAGAGKGILVLDEIGKMELFSTPFKNKVNELFGNSNQVILGTVPLKTSSSIPLVDKIKNHPNTVLINVNQTNRNSLTDVIMNYVSQAAAASSLSCVLLYLTYLDLNPWDSDEFRKQKTVM